MSVLVFAELSDGKLKKPALEAATYAADLAKQEGLEVAAVTVGTADDAELARIGSVGIGKIYSVKGDQFAAFNDGAYAGAVAEVAKKVGAKFVILPQSYDSRALAPRLAVKLGAALLSGVNTLLKKGGAGYVAQRGAYSGKAFQNLSTGSGTVVVTVKSNAYGVKETGGSASVEAFAYSPAASAFRVKSVKVEKATGTIPLTEADVVVSAGRGLKGPENWGPVEELANLLGAATACSKPVADVHWRPHHEHVGQTGITVSPNVYIAIGISGAIQHLAGVSSSKTIIVINKDPEAPFFKAADYGVVGDAFEVLPALVSAVKAAKG